MIDDLSKNLQAMEDQLELAKEDLEQGDYRRVRVAFSTIQFIARNSEELIRDGAAKAISKAKAGNVGRPRTPEGDALASCIITVLEDSGQPLALREIIRKVEEKGVGLPGEGKPANFISYLRRPPEVVRVHRGVYALKQWDLEASQ